MKMHALFIATGDEPKLLGIFKSPADAWAWEKEHQDEYDFNTTANWTQETYVHI